MYYVFQPEGKEENWSKGEVVTLNADNNNKAVIIFNPDFPDNVVEGSEFVTVSFIGKSLVLFTSETCHK